MMIRVTHFDQSIVFFQKKGLKGQTPLSYNFLLETSRRYADLKCKLQELSQFSNARKRSCFYSIQYNDGQKIATSLVGTMERGVI